MVMSHIARARLILPNANLKVTPHHKAHRLLVSSALDVHVPILSALTGSLWEVLCAVAWDLVHERDNHTDSLLVDQFPEVS